MHGRTLLFAQFWVALVLSILHNVGFAYSLYWRFPWFDIVTHLLGGIWAGFFVLWVSMLRKKTPALALCIAGAFAIGVAWELFEALFGVTQYPADTLDTLKDIAMDTLGGLGAWFLARPLTRP